MQFSSKIPQVKEHTVHLTHGDLREAVKDYIEKNYNTEFSLGRCFADGSPLDPRFSHYPVKYNWTIDMAGKYSATVTWSEDLTKDDVPDKGKGPVSRFNERVKPATSV